MDPQVQLATYKPDEACQLWRVLEHEDPTDVQSEDTKSSTQTSTRNEVSASSGPSETLVIAEDKDVITTTRTSTTVTTVTTVTKTPRHFLENSEATRDESAEASVNAQGVVRYANDSQRYSNTERCIGAC